MLNSTFDVISAQVYFILLSFFFFLPFLAVLLPLGFLFQFKAASPPPNLAHVDSGAGTDFVGDMAENPKVMKSLKRAAPSEKAIT